MKTNFIRFFDRAIMALLGFFPFVTGCDDPKVEYGTPYAEFNFRGVVSDKTTSQPVPSMRVIIKNEHKISIDTAYTNSEGKYSVEFTDIPDIEETFYILTEDVDGELSGGLYKPNEVSVTVSDAEFVRGKDNGGWYVGKATKEVNIKVEK